MRKERIQAREISGTAGRREPIRKALRTLPLFFLLLAYSVIDFLSIRVVVGIRTSIDRDDNVQSTLRLDQGEEGNVLSLQRQDSQSQCQLSACMEILAYAKTCIDEVKFAVGGSGIRSTVES